MANTKKKTTTKKGKASTKGKKGKAKTTKKGKQQKFTFYETNRTTLVLIYLAVALFLLAAAFIPGLNFWAKVRGVFFGFFGIGFYAFALSLLVIGFRIALDNLRYGFILTTVSGFGIGAAISSFVHLFTNEVLIGGTSEWFSQLKAAASDGWYISEEGLLATGGVVGGFFGGGLMFLTGKIIAFLVILILLAVFSIVFLGISFSDVGYGISDLIVGAKNKIDVSAGELKVKRAENKEKRKEEKARQLEEKRRMEEEARALLAVQKDEGDDFDFAKSDVNTDYEKRNDGNSSFTRFREMNSPVKNESIFTTYTPRTDSQVKDVKIRDYRDDVKPAEKKPEPEAKTSAEAETFDEVSKELSQEAQNIVDAAVSNAEKNALKNKAEVEGYKDEKRPKKEYSYPPIDCLQEPDFSKEGDFALEMRATATKLVDTLKSFGVETTLIGVSRGPSVTRYELQPAPGVKISKITNLADDIALNLASSGVRIEAPIPNKSAVGIEVPNQTKSMVTLRELISSAEFKKSKSKLNVALGKDITGDISCADLAKMPHLLIAGTTGSGKSVCLNGMIVSILYNAKPDEVKLLMIDPKQVEFSVYNGIPHLLVPVISDARKAAGSLAWAVGEMERRYKTFSTCGVRDIGGFNKYILTHPEFEYMPQIVIFIDELNDLMMISPKEVEDSICRLAQKARAAGMHLVVATQRPSVDVITGIIKANIPSRISLSVSSQVDSRTILDTIGAEKLLGNGDMLFNPVGVSKPVRIQGGYVSDSEIEKIIDFIKNQAKVEYDDNIMDEIEKNATADKKQPAAGAAGDSADDGSDEMIDRAIQTAIECEVISVSLLQRKLRIGYARAARIVDELDERGLVGPQEGGGKPRKFLMTRAQYLEMKASRGEEAPADSDDDGDFDILSD